MGTRTMNFHVMWLAAILVAALAGPVSAASYVPDATNIPHDQLTARRTLLAEGTLRDAGFAQLLHLEGDRLAWEAAQRPVERPSL